MTVELPLKPTAISDGTWNPNGFDVRRTYYVVAYNREYHGESNGLEFSRGVARVDGLQSKDPERIQARIDRLNWFKNAHVVQLFDAGGKKSGTAPAYVIQTEVPSAIDDEQGDEE